MIRRRTRFANRTIGRRSRAPGRTRGRPRAPGRPRGRPPALGRPRARALGLADDDEDNAADI
jgi:hypothetical protein